MAMFYHPIIVLIPCLLPFFFIFFLIFLLFRCSLLADLHLDLGGHVRILLMLPHHSVGIGVKGASDPT